MKKILGNKKILIGLVLLLVVGFGVYQKVLKPKPVTPKKKVEGALVTLPDAFVVNLSGGHYGKLSVSLLLAKAPPVSKAAAENAPPMPEYAVVRSLITDALTGLEPNDLIDRGQRHRLLQRLEEMLNRKTDEPVKSVLLTDVAVQ